MKIICPKCRKDMQYPVSMTFTDKGDCPHCGNVLDLKDCTMLVWVRIAFIILMGAIVYLYGDEIVAKYIPDTWLRLLPLVLAAVIPIVIGLHLISPVIYNRIYVNKDHMKEKKKRL